MQKKKLTKFNTSTWKENHLTSYLGWPKNSFKMARKNPNKLFGQLNGIRREHPQPVSGFCEEPTANIILNWKRLYLFSLRFRGKRRFTSAASVQHFTGDSCQGNYTRKWSKSCTLERCKIICKWHVFLYKNPKEYACTYAAMRYTTKSKF